MLIREMEKLKDPAMLLSVANSIGLVGTTAYFYKQLESVRIDMVKMADSLKAIARKMSEMEKGDQHKNDALHTLNDQVKRIDELVQELPSFEAMDNVDLDLSELYTVLEDNNIVIERPSLQPTYGRGRKGGDRRVPRRMESDTEDRRDIRRVPKALPETRPRPRDSGRESTRDTRNPRTEPVSSYNDDSDLIEQVRRQQQPSHI